MALNEYKPGTSFPGVIGRTVDVSQHLPGRRPNRPKEGAPNVLFIVLGRHRVRPTRLLRRAHSHAESRRAGSRRVALQQLPHDRAVLAHPRLPGDRAQPPFQRHGLHHRGRHRLSRQQRDGPLRERLPLGDPAAERLQHLRRRQMASDPGPRDVGGRAVRPLAAGPRVPALLRLPGRRHAPVLPRAGLRQPPGRAGEDARSGLPSYGGSGRQGHQLSSPTPSRSCPTSRSSSISPPAPCTRRITCPRNGPTSTRASSTRLGRLPREGLCPPEGAGRDSRRRRAVAPRSRRQALERVHGRRAQGLCAHDGSVRRFPGAHRPSYRPPARLPQTHRRLRQHADHRRVGQRGQFRGRAQRDDQHQPVAQQPARHGGGQSGGAG